MSASGPGPAPEAGENVADVQVILDVRNAEFEEYEISGDDRTVW